MWWWAQVLEGCGVAAIASKTASKSKQENEPICNHVKEIIRAGGSGNMRIHLQVQP